MILFAFAKYLALYLLIIMALFVAALRAKSREVKLCLYVLLLFALVVPLTKYSFQKYKNERIEIEYKKKINESNNAFSQFCRDHQAKVYKNVKAKRNNSIYIRVIKPFAGDSRLFHADYISATLKHKGLCQKIGLKYIEGNNYKQQWCKYEVCGSSNGKLVSKITAQYELIIDGSTTTSQMSWDEMIKNEIRIVDKKTGDVLAEDIIFFLGTETGKASCPDATDQAIDLIQNVFGKTGEQ